MIKIKDLKEAIIKTNAELEEDKWIDRYDNYADLMLKYEENKIELEHITACINSWKGYAKFANSYNLINKILEKFILIK